MPVVAFIEIKHELFSELQPLPLLWLPGKIQVKTASQIFQQLPPLCLLPTLYVYEAYCIQVLLRLCLGVFD